MDKKRNDLKRGVIVFAGLAALTAVEFALAVLTSLYGLLLVTALIKAGLVIWYYMHIRKVFVPGEAE
jgi:heme/copper-type cytochrome/quinol oxidase subunit 4